jgi:hypothetical protein
MCFLHMLVATFCCGCLSVTFCSYVHNFCFLQGIFLSKISARLEIVTAIVTNVQLKYLLDYNLSTLNGKELYN